MTVKSRRMFIEQSGPLASLQDLGRQGGQALGFTQTGAADEYSFLWANKLLGNSPNAAALEIAVGTFRCTFDSETFIAITGASGRILVNHTQYQGWQSIHVHAGDVLEIGAAQSGVYYYLAIAGGFASNRPKMFNSVASSAREFNQYDKPKELSYSSLQTSPISKNRYTGLHERLVPARFTPDFRHPLELGFYPCYQFNQFKEAVQQQFLTQSFVIDRASNKMGVRLNGEPIKAPKTQQFSEGIALGAIQLPADGSPIILLKDRQTIGGYPKIGSIARIDTFQLSQRRAGQSVHFVERDMKNAQHELAKFYRFFRVN